MEVSALKMDISVQNNAATRLANSTPVANNRAGGQSDENPIVDKAVNETAIQKGLPSAVEKNSAVNENKKISDEDVPATALEKAIENANKGLITTGRQLKYSIHEKTHKIMVSVVDSKTKEVVKEIPPEKVLDTYAKMLELAGLFFDEKR